MTRRRWGVLVLSGSSGRDESARAAAIGSWGVAAQAYRWFGGPGQVPGICEVPLESFGDALDSVREQADHVAVLGTSKGAEAALLLGAHDPRVEAVVALSPPAHVWSNVGPGVDGRDRPQRSSFTSRGEPLPFVAALETDVPEVDGRLVLRGLYAASVDACSDEAAARIPVGSVAGPVLVSGGGDDQVWPSDVWASAIARDRDASGLPTSLVLDPHGGHGVVLPGEAARPAGRLAYGGSAATDTAVGIRVRDELARLLDL